MEYLKDSAVTAGASVDSKHPFTQLVSSAARLTGVGPHLPLYYMYVLSESELSTKYSN